MYLNQGHRNMFKDTRIATKVIAGFFFAILIALVIGIVGRQGLVKLESALVDVAEVKVPTVIALEELSVAQFRADAGLRGLMIPRATDRELRQSYYDLAIGGMKDLAENRRVYEPIPQLPEETVIWRQAAPRLDEWMQASRQLVELQRAKDSLLSRNVRAEDPQVAQLDERSFQILRQVGTASADAHRLVDQIAQLYRDLTTTDTKAATVATAANINTIVSTLGLGVLVMLLMAAFISRDTTKAITALINEARKLSSAAVSGQLSTRGELELVPREFRPILKGVNDTLDAVTGPLNVAADYVEKISKGNIPPKITDRYNGDFNTIKNNLNQCIEAVNLLVDDASNLTKEAIEGKLGTRADASKHQGDFRRVVEGVNTTLDAVIDPIMEATKVLEGLAQYDLRVRVMGNYNGDHARIKEALNGSAKALHDALSQVSESVEQISEASQQIASSSQSVAQGASEQASSLEETSSSLEEMASMTKQNADNTVQARSLAQTTKEAAEAGGKAMLRMMDAMEKIRAASEGTAQIIKDINDIAFQTNLLALNAAVEAARAGDAGRGFAVVAEEVRNLALRAKEAAKKTEDLIRMSVGHAENGRVISSEVAGSLNRIVSAAGKVNDIVGEIAVASEEQTRGIDQVNTAVSEMDKVVQVAAANAEESSSAAEELSSQSEELAGLVARFVIERAQTEKRQRIAVSSSAPVRRGPPPMRPTTSRSRIKLASGAKEIPFTEADEASMLHSDLTFKDF